MTAPGVAFDGTQYVVVWQQYDATGFRPRYSRVNLAGQVLDPGGLALGSGNSLSATRGAGSTLLAVGNRLTRVTSQGTTLDSGGVTPVSTTNAPAMASDGSGYLLLDKDRVYALSDALQLQTPAGIQVHQAGDAPKRALAFAGPGYVMTWQDQQGVHAARVEASGALIDTTPIQVSADVAWRADPSSVAAASHAGLTYLAWSRRPPEDQQLTYQSRGAIQVARLDASGTVLDPGGKAVATPALSQLPPKVASDGTHFLMVWQEPGEYRPSAPAGAIKAVRVSQAGQPLDPVPLVATTSGRNPAVLFEGPSYLVLWQRDRKIHASRVSLQGTVVNQPGLLSAEGAFVRGARGRQTTLVLGETRACRLDSAGTVLDPTGFDLPALQGGLAAGSDGFLVAALRDNDLELTLVPEQGPVTALSTEHVSTTLNAGDPAVAFNGKEFLVTWMAYGGGLNSGTLMGQRVSALGKPLGPPIVLSSAPGQRYYSSVAATGETFLVVWFDSRNEFAGDLYFTQVRPGGQVTHPGGTLLLGGPGAQTWPSLATNAANLTLLGYQGFDSAPDFRRLRARGLLIAGEEDGTPCQSAHECRSDRCVEGVCCTTCGYGSQGDGGPSDPSPSDASRPADAGSPSDAGLEATGEDAGLQAPPPEPARPSGCGCGASGPTGLLVPLLVFGAWRRRGRQAA